jgi:hypothetical protein
MVYSEILAEAAARSGNPKLVGIVGELSPDISSSSEHFDAHVEGVSSKPTASFILRPINTEQQHETKRNAGAAVKVISIPADRTQHLDKPNGTIIIPFHPKFEELGSNQPRVLKYLEESHTKWIPATCIGLVSLAIIGAISRFRWGDSTPSQRGIVIAWLICTAGFTMIQFLLGFVTSFIFNRHRRILPKLWIGLQIIQHLLSTGVLLALFVTVGQELVEYGNCTYFS